MTVPNSVLSTRLTKSLTLTSPILLASGTVGFGTETADLATLNNVGAIVTPTLTSAPSVGNTMPRTAEATAGLIHSLGLPNPGIAVFLLDWLPCLQSLHCPLVASVHGETLAEWQALVTKVSIEGVTAIELNLSLPNTNGEANILRCIQESVAMARKSTSHPLFVKLPSINVEIGEAARIAEAEGADVIVVGQAYPAVAVRLSNRSFRFPKVVGELSGPAIKPLTLYQVWRTVSSVKIPVVGGGGIFTVEDVLEFLIAGASAVSLGIANTIHPNRVNEINDGLLRYLEENDIASLQALRAN